VTASDLAMIGAVLANRGIHPKSGARLLKEECVPAILAEVASNGMYDASGNWLHEVGLPAKSGVGGGVLAIAPGRTALAAFSPPLDEFRNSVRAQAAVANIVKQGRLGLFDA
jgi:glutaminase